VHCAPAAHHRHRPEQTLLHALVREHLPAFLAHTDESYERPLPRYVRRAFESYLRCGLPEHGFLRLRCEDCGHDRVVAFSCKERGPCPSCSARTMCNAAAHLTDRVLPNVPIRQWVLSLPFDLRALAAKRPEVAAAIDRALFAEIERWMRRTAGPATGRAGAVTFVQRFGGSLNLNVHLHVLVLEGLFTREDDALPIFHPALPPTRADLLEVVTRVRDRVFRWIHRRGLDERTFPTANEAIDACAREATQRGLFDQLPTAKLADDDEPFAGKHSIALDGFDLHAAVHIGSDDDVGRERLVRYCARPPFALERLSQLPDGRVAYQIKQPRKGASHRILTPLDLLARVAALIPPPRHPFMRYHGVLAPNSKWRKAIVPRDTTPRSSPTSSLSPNREALSDKPPARTTPPATPELPARSRPAPPPSSKPSPVAPSHPATAPSPRAHFVTISPPHRVRLDDGALLATRPRIDWAKLLRRTYAEDILRCPRCRGPSRVIAAIHSPETAATFLAAARQLSSPDAARLVGDATWPSHDDEDDDSQIPPPSSNPRALHVPDD